MALFSLRAAVAILLIRDSILVWEGSHPLICCAGLALAALCLVAGLLTPTFCLVAMVLTIVGWLWNVDAWPQSFLVVSVLASMALLGPGAYSLDARLFGRKKLRIGHSTN